MRIKKFPLLLSCLLLVGILNACKDSEKTDDPGTDPETTEVKPVDTVYAWVDDLLIREEPNQKGKRVDQVKEGSAILYLGEKTDFTDKIKLRGKQYDEPWYKVKTGKGKEGWVYGGAVRFKKALTAEEIKKLELLNDLKSDKTTWLIVPGKRVGWITPNTSENDLRDKYGSANVITDDIYLGDGMFEKGTIIFQGKKEHADIVYKNSELKKEPTMIRVAMKGSPWTLENGIKIGTTLTELVEMNGRDIDFQGFDWDFGGFVSTYNRGNLNWLSGKITLRLYPKDGANLRDRFYGDILVSSSDPDLDTDDIFVDEIQIWF